MESIINKLTEIESAASAIAEHAELQKSVLDKNMKKSESSLIWIWNKRHRHICKKSGKLWKQIRRLS